LSRVFVRERFDWESVFLAGLKVICLAGEIAVVRSDTPQYISIVWS